MDKEKEAIDKLRQGIAVYQHQQDVFLRLLRKRKQFTEAEFDHWFRGREWRRPSRFTGLRGDTILLGIGANGFNLWAERLELLQIMCAIGLVRATTEGGMVVYRETPA